MILIECLYSKRPSAAAGWAYLLYKSNIEKYRAQLQYDIVRQRDINIRIGESPGYPSSGVSF